MRSVVIPLSIGPRSTLRGRAEPQVEIAALHQQLAVLWQHLSGRPRFRPVDRFFRTWLSQRWPGWLRALVSVQPEKLGWHRRSFRLL